MSVPDTLAGAALAEAVAVEVMGWRYDGGVHWLDDVNRLGLLKRYWRPDYDISIAWPLVERFGLTVAPNGQRWDVGLFNWDSCDRGFDWYVSADTAPEAICLAALRIARAAGGRE